jgi:hypothetical protein
MIGIITKSQADKLLNYDDFHFFGKGIIKTILWMWNRKGYIRDDNIKCNNIKCMGYREAMYVTEDNFYDFYGIKEWFYNCPSCNSRDVIKHKKYCPDCGIELIWEDNNDR